MRPHDRSRRLMIFVDACDTWNHRPWYVEIVHRAYTAALAGTSVFRSVEGGASARIHTSRWLSLSQDLPIAVIIVDDASAIDAFLPRRDELMHAGLVTPDDVECTKFVAQPREAPP